MGTLQLSAVYRAYCNPGDAPKTVVGSVSAADPPSLTDEKIGPAEKRLHVSANHGQNFLHGTRPETGADLE